MMSRHFIFSINHNEKWEFPPMFIFPYCRSKKLFFQRSGLSHFVFSVCSSYTQHPRHQKCYISFVNQRDILDLFGMLSRFSFKQCVNIFLVFFLFKNEFSKKKKMKENYQCNIMIGFLRFWSKIDNEFPIFCH